MFNTISQLFFNLNIKPGFTTYGPFKRGGVYVIELADQFAMDVKTFSFETREAAEEFKKKGVYDYIDKYF